MRRIILLFTLISSCLMIAQTTTAIEWQKSFGGNAADFANSIQQTSDGGYIVAGTSSSNDGDVSGNHGDYDCWIVKLNSNGNVQWQKSLGGSDYDNAFSVQQTTDGGYIVAGISRSNDGDVSGNHGDYDCWIVKLDSSGTVQWQKSLGGSGLDKANYIQQTADGGYIIAGESYSNDGDVSGHHGTTNNVDAWIVKIDNSGNIQWQKSLGGTGEEYSISIQQTTDGGYIFTGESYSNDGDITGHHGTNNYDYWVVKLDSNGAIQWQRSLGGSKDDFSTSILQTTDDGYIVAGYSNSNDGDVSGNHGDLDYWIVKLDSSGAIQWQKSLGGSAIDYAQSIQKTTDGGYIVAGVSFSNNSDVNGNHGANDYWIVKLGSSGTIQWQRSLGGSKLDIVSSIRQTSDDGYIVAGYSDSNDGDVSGNQGGVDYWIVKLSADGLATEEINLSKINIYPNPVRETLYFSDEVFNIKIIDVSGKILQNIPTKTKILNFANFIKGVYIVSATTKTGEIINRKIVKD